MKGVPRETDAEKRGQPLSLSWPSGRKRRTIAARLRQPI
jgi:hypothetical protein